jgi:hypothetical protein
MPAGALQLVPDVRVTVPPAAPAVAAPRSRPRRVRHLVKFFM